MPMPAVLFKNSISRAHERLQALPLVTLYLTERCNSRCISCDYWRSGRRDLDMAAVERLLPSLAALGTQVVLISGGEPLLNPQWLSIARRLRMQNLALWLLTSGLALAKHALRVAEVFERVTVSLDGTNRDTYAAIRGLDAFDAVCAGIRSMADNGTPTTLRVTLQRANYRELPAFVDLARSLGAQQISFLAADVASVHAFGRSAQPTNDLALSAADLPDFERVLDALSHSHTADFSSGFIAESPAKLRRLLQYFSALRGHGSFPEVRCNAPEFSAVVETGGNVRPCFFISGPPRDTGADSLATTLNSEGMMGLRAAIRAGERPECRTCVCSMYRP
jgi:Fe-coproporphyrin III synthase